MATAVSIVLLKVRRAFRRPPFPCTAPLRPLPRRGPRQSSALSYNKYWLLCAPCPIFMLLVLFCTPLRSSAVTPKASHYRPLPEVAAPAPPPPSPGSCVDSDGWDKDRMSRAGAESDAEAPSLLRSATSPAYGTPRPAEEWEDRHESPTLQLLNVPMAESSALARFWTALLRFLRLVFRGEPGRRPLWPALLFVVALQGMPSSSVLVSVYYIGASREPPGCHLWLHRALADDLHYRAWVKSLITCVSSAAAVGATVVYARVFKHRSLWTVRGAGMVMGGACASHRLPSQTISTTTLVACAASLLQIVLVTGAYHAIRLPVELLIGIEATLLKFCSTVGPALPTPTTPTHPAHTRAVGVHARDRPRCVPLPAWTGSHGIRRVSVRS